MMRSNPLPTVLLALTLLVAAAPSQAQQEAAPAAAQQAPQRERRPAGMIAYYSAVLKELALEGEARESFIAAVRQRQESLDAWDREKKPDLDQARTQREAARAAGDTARLNQALAAVKELEESRSAVEAKANAALRDTLTPQQRGAWAAYDSYRGQLQRFGRLDLTDDQKAQIKSLCLKFADDLNGVDPADRKALNAVRARIAQAVTAQVLTDDQRQRLKTPRQEAPKPAAEQAQPAQQE